MTTDVLAFVLVRVPLIESFKHTHTSMYNKQAPVAINLSVSASLDNLTHSKHKNVDYLAVHDSENKISIILMSSSGNVIKEIVFEPANEDNRYLIQRVKLILLHESLFLVAASSRTVKVYSVATNPHLLLSYNFMPETKLGQTVHSMDALSKNVFGVGTQSKVYFFTTNSTGSSVKSKELHQDLRSNQRSLIYNFTSNGQLQCAIEESVGLITVWKFDDHKNTFSKLRTIEIHPNTKSTVQRIFENILVLATISGQVQLISLASGHLLCEIQAHVKCITSFDMAAKNRYLVTVSEDSHLRVFRLLSSKEDSCQIELMHQMTIDNELICGVKFLDSAGQLIAISCYESREIKLFKMNQ